MMWERPREDTGDAGSSGRASGRKMMLVRGEMGKAGRVEMCAKHLSGQWEICVGLQLGEVR